LIFVNRKKNRLTHWQCTWFLYNRWCSTFTVEP